MKRLYEIKVKKQGEVLTDEEMKTIKGGDSYILCMASNGRWFTTDSYAVADAWCNVWSGFGYDCSCRGRSPYIEC